MAASERFDRSQRGLFQVDFRRHLAQLKHEQQQSAVAGEHPPTPETIQFRTFTELAAWASQQAVAAERQR